MYAFLNSLIWSIVVMLCAVFFCLPFLVFTFFFQSTTLYTTSPSILHCTSSQTPMLYESLSRLPSSTVLVHNTLLIPSSSNYSFKLLAASVASSALSACVLDCLSSTNTFIITSGYAASPTAENTRLQSCCVHSPSSKLPSYVLISNAYCKAMCIVTARGFFGPVSAS